MSRHKLGLHTKDERDYALALSNESFTRGMEIAGRGDARALCDLTFEIGMLHAIALLAKQEKSDLLEAHAARLKAVLDQEARKMGR